MGAKRGFAILVGGYYKQKMGAKRATILHGGAPWKTPNGKNP